MEKILTAVWIRELLTEVQSWSVTNLFTLVTLLQLVLIAGILAAASSLAGKLSVWIDSKAQAWRERGLSLIASRIHLTSREISFLLLSPPLLWISVAATAAVGWPVIIANGAASLVTAWAVIRLGSSLIKSNFWSRTLAISMWTIAALNIVGWLDPAIGILGNAVITYGDFKLSMLTLIEGAVLLAVLLWLAGLASEGMERMLGRSNLPPAQKVLFHKISKILLISLSVLIGLNIVGIDLTALAVFSGALGIGIGFGLQKVFANLMSGFILLMDKSIKPGDVIAVGDTYGWVNRLGARYVSILTRDGKEHLIPNEILITEPVENWTYSDDKIRIHVPIGVSYKVDVPKVRQLMLEIAEKLPRVLKYPPPVCLIKGFGESSVDLELRVWIEDAVNGIANVRSVIYEEAWKVFKENNVEIPYPQRDLNLDMAQMKELLRMMKKEWFESINPHPVKSEPP
ncbi:MAG: mechanosensitive ion channel family protein [Pseudomonadota bacterium]